MAKDKKNTGIDNTGENNSGNWNSGYGNSGDRNSGDWNSGDWNSGNRNSGNWNSGDWNSGYGNSGYGNSGNWNSGNWNSGYGNSGNWNSGDWNSGNWNSGYGNSGNWNSGNWNSGYGNSTERETGIFNSTPGTLRMFNKPTNKKWDDIDHPHFNEFHLNKWIPESEMTEAEKKADPDFFVRQGYLKTFTWEEAWADYWKDTTKKDRQRVLNLPNFDATVFKEITGIDVEVSDKPKTINIGGTEYEVTDELKNALKGLKEA